MQVNSDNPTSSTYSSNPLIKPLIKLHGQITSSFDNLFSQREILKITKRVLIIVIAPFAYLTLGLLALTGLAFNSTFQNRNVKTTPNQPSQTSFISVELAYNSFKEQIISTVNQAKTINQIQSAKIFINIECNNKIFNKDYIIKQLDSSDQFFLSKIVDKILTEAKDSFKTQNTESLSFNSTTLIKDENGVFHKASSSKKSLHCKGEYTFTDFNDIGQSIDANSVEKYFKIVFKKMGREFKPQLDDQLNFID